METDVLWGTIFKKNCAFPFQFLLTTYKKKKINSLPEKDLVQRETVLGFWGCHFQRQTKEPQQLHLLNFKAFYEALSHAMNQKSTGASFHIPEDPFQALTNNKQDGHYNHTFGWKWRRSDGVMPLPYHSLDQTLLRAICVQQCYDGDGRLNFSSKFNQVWWQRNATSFCGVGYLLDL